MNRHDLEKLNVAYTQVHEKKDSSYLETDMKKRQENNEKARKDMAKVKGQKNPHFEEVENVEELYKGKHGQSEKQYQDSRSDAGKMVSGDSKMSGSKYAQGRRTGSDAGAQPAGGSQKPASQGKMDSGSRIDLTFRKVALKKKADGMKKEKTVAEDAKMAKQSDEKLSALHKQVTSSDQSLPSNQFMLKRVQKEMNRRKKVTKEEVEQVAEVMTPALIGGTLGAVTGKKGKKLQSGVGAGAGAAVGAAMGGPVGAIVGGLVGKKVAEEILRKSIVELENVDEAMSSYDKNRKRAAQRAADRNAARAAGKTGAVPGVGYVTARKEKETYTDEKGTVRHKSGAKNE